MGQMAWLLSAIKRRLNTFFSLPWGDWFYMLSCAGSLFPGTLGSLCKDSQKYCKCAFNGLTGASGTSRRQATTNAKSCSWEEIHCVSMKVRDWLAWEQLFKRDLVDLVDHWTWIQHHAHAVTKVNHIHWGQVLIPLCPGLVGLNLEQGVWFSACSTWDTN